LVLGAGGIAGIAWITGVLQGLASEGADLTHADRLIGTSAGAVVAAAVTGGYELSDFYARLVTLKPRANDGPDFDWRAFSRHIGPILFGPRDPVKLARRIGELSLQTKSSGADSLHEAIAGFLPSDIWPLRPLTIVTVDAETGAPKLFDETSAVSLIAAVCASCAVPAVWAPIAINGRLYMDGGARCLDNADLAAGCRTAVVLSPFGATGLDLSPRRLPVQLRALKQAGTKVTVISPDWASRRSMGLNPLSPHTQKPAAEAGFTQGRALAREVAAFLKA